MTDVVFTVRVVLDGDDDTDQAAAHLMWKLERSCIELCRDGIVKDFRVVREP